MLQYWGYIISPKSTLFMLIIWPQYCGHIINPMKYRCPQVGSVRGCVLLYVFFCVWNSFELFLLLLAFPSPAPLVCSFLLSLPVSYYYLHTCCSAQKQSPWDNVAPKQLKLILFCYKIFLLICKICY